MFKHSQPEDTPPVQFHDLYEEQVLTEQVRQLYALAPIGVLATAANSLLVFFVLKDVLPSALLIPWLATVLTVTALRLWLVHRYHKVHLEPATAPLWARRFLAGLTAIGASWGAIGVFPFSGLSMAHQVFIAFVLGGMCAGASSTFAPSRHAYLVYSVPVLAPLALHFFLMNDTFHYVMGGMTSLFGYLLWRISVHNYALNRSSLLLRFENRQMIETLKKANEHAEELNSQLRTEIEARRAAEADLWAHKEHLEEVVEDRTADLRVINERLKAEIEERKQYEKALRDSQERLVQAQRHAEAANIAKGQFLANMSHEMRTPLAGTLGMLKLVLGMELGAEERQLLEMAKRSADSLLRIIADLLDFSRLDAGMMTFERKPFSVSEVVKSAIEVVSLNAGQKKLHLFWNVDDSLPEQVTGDEGRVRQALVNLLGNAVKFTEKGEVEVSVRAFSDPEWEGIPCLLFSVRDTGVGIPAEQLDKIFGRFTQVDSSLTRKHGGTGLGLALTRQIVEKMGGRIWVESSEGVGSTFYFTFPLEPVAKTG